MRNFVVLSAAALALALGAAQASASTRTDPIPQSLNDQAFDSQQFGAASNGGFQVVYPDSPHRNR